MDELAGGGRVEATPSERVESGSDTGGDEIVSVAALKFWPKLNPHWLQNLAISTLAAPQLTHDWSGSPSG